MLGAATDQPETILILSMLEKNLVADQDEWDKAFQREPIDPHLSWAFDEEEGVSEDEGVNQNQPPRATHISGGPVLEGFTIDQAVQKTFFSLLYIY